MASHLPSLTVFLAPEVIAVLEPTARVEGVSVAQLVREACVTQLAADGGKPVTPLPEKGRTHRLKMHAGAALLALIRDSARLHGVSNSRWVACAVEAHLVRWIDKHRDALNRQAAKLGVRPLPEHREAV